jgi:RNA recognition motif-containing protein
MGRKLYVGNLPYETNEDDLQNLFAQAGAVESVNVMRDRETGRARGFAFVEMVSDEDAQNAITQLNEQRARSRRRWRWSAPPIRAPLVIVLYDLQGPATPAGPAV